MATLYTHVVVGLGLGTVLTSRRKPLLFWMLAGFLPIIPDFDAFSMSPLRLDPGPSRVYAFAAIRSRGRPGDSRAYILVFQDAFLATRWALFSDHGFARHLGPAHQWRVRYPAALAVY